MSVIDYVREGHEKTKTKYAKIKRLVERTEIDKEQTREYIAKIKGELTSGNGGKKGQRFFVYMRRGFLHSMAELDIWLNQDGIRSRGELVCMLIELYMERDSGLLEIIRQRLGKGTPSVDNKLRKKYDEAIDNRKKILGEQSGLSGEDIIDIFDAVEEENGK